MLCIFHVPLGQGMYLRESKEMPVEPSVGGSSQTPWFIPEPEQCRLWRNEETRLCCFTSFKFINLYKTHFPICGPWEQSYLHF